MKTSTRKLTLSALFLALGLVLPLITGQIPQIGKMPICCRCTFPCCCAAWYAAGRMAWPLAR
ncbi:MAG: hypothetical protein ACLTZH_05525 [Subdoligranulum sp.]